VITTTNITLVGGAPNQVDGVNLSVNDRVLVIGQSTGSQNGIYYVTTVGTGSNGTWTRSSDTDATGELLAGTIVMVTEGTVYHDTQWKLTTNDPIVIGTTALVFEQNSAFAFGNVYANGTAVLATSVGDVLTLTAGNNIQIIGNNSSKSVAIAVTGISLTSIANGTSNVNVTSSGGNVTVGVAGTNNIAVFTSGGMNVTGNVSASGNVLGNGAGLTGINSFSNVTVTGGNSVIADSISDTLTITAGSGISIVADSANDTITIATASSGGGIFSTGGDMGTVTEAVTTSQDLGLVTDVPATVFYDLGSVIDATGLIYPSQLVLPTYTPSTLPGANPAAQFIFLSTSSIGAMTAFSDGTNWRFTSSGNVVS
jgi:hypothetical protein